MSFRRLIAALLLLLSSASLYAQVSGQTVLVIPFDNQSQAPGLQWIGNSFPEFLHDRLTSRTSYALTREDRVRAYDRLGIPADIHASRATIYRIAEQMDVDCVVLGSYNFDGRTFSTTAQLLDMRRNGLSPQFTESGPLTGLITVQSALAWDLLHALHPGISGSKTAYIDSVPPIRLDSFENFVRGVTSNSDDEQIRHLREAVRLDPNYTEALLALGKAYYRQGQNADAMAWLGRVPPDSPQSREAAFYLGLAAYAKKDYDKAESAFRLVASRLPFPEIYNNLGAVEFREGKDTAVDDLEKAVDTDPTDADYRFNLALALYRAGDLGGAAHHLRQALILRPSDSDSRSLLDLASNPSVHARAKARLPGERIRRNYDEGSFRQLALEVEAAAEQKLAKADSHTHAKFHADRGHEFLTQGFVAEAEQEFREALRLDSSNAEAHAGLAGVLAANGDDPGARSEANSALGLKQFAEPLLVIADLDLRDNRADSAAEAIERALTLAPGNVKALAMKRTIAAKLAEKAQPLPSR